MTATRGRFLVIEGIDGAGKTSQIEALRTWLPESGLMPSEAALVVTREPGGTPLGQHLRRLLLHAPADRAPSPNTELLLYAADRAQHVSTVIRPALERGDWVLCDRYTGSTLAYQGWGRGLSTELILRLEAIATEGLGADVTLWLDLPVPVARQRRGMETDDRIEVCGGDFQQRVAKGFAALCLERNWLRLNATTGYGQVMVAIRQALQHALGTSG